MNATASFRTAISGNFSLQRNSTFPAPFVPSVSITEHTFWLAITLALIIIGLIPNFALFLVTFPRDERRSSGFQLLMFHLITVNLVCLLNAPIGPSLVHLKRNGFVVTQRVCENISVFATTAMCVVSWTELFLAVNRCIALIYPHRYKFWSTRPVSLALILFSWLAGCVAVVPPAMFRIGGEYSAVAIGLCSYKPVGALGQFFIAVMKFFPYSVTGTCCVLIVWKSQSFFWSRTRQVGTKEISRVQKHRLAMAKMTLLNFLWTSACNFPAFLILSLFPALTQSQPASALWSRLGLTCQYSLTPYILLLLNGDYRNRVGLLIGRNKRGGSGGDASAPLNSHTPGTGLTKSTQM